MYIYVYVAEFKFTREWMYVARGGKVILCNATPLKGTHTHTYVTTHTQHCMYVVHTSMYYTYIHILTVFSAVP